MCSLRVCARVRVCAWRAGRGWEGHSCVAYWRNGFRPQCVVVLALRQCGAGATRCTHTRYPADMLARRAAPCQASTRTSCGTRTTGRCKPSPSSSSVYVHAWPRIVHTAARATGCVVYAVCCAWSAQVCALQRRATGCVVNAVCCAWSAQVCALQHSGPGIRVVC